ncbi:hypothetical protein [Bryocella elongata]|nr:hypothetical protein [Bryocella elongata]
MTNGTAAKALGGDVTVIVRVSGGAGTCDFLRDAGKGSEGRTPEESDRLMIQVSPLPPKECVTGEPVVGIGEDSLYCTSTFDGMQREIIRGRVRETYFVVILSSDTKGATSRTTARANLEQAAEQIAGNLF